MFHNKCNSYFYAETCGEAGPTDQEEREAGADQGWGGPD